MIGEEVISAAAGAPPPRGRSEEGGGGGTGGGVRVAAAATGVKRKMVIDSKLTFRAAGNCRGFPISNKGWKSQIRMKTASNC